MEGLTTGIEKTASKQGISVFVFVFFISIHLEGLLLSTRFFVHFLAVVARLQCESA